MGFYLLTYLINFLTSVFLGCFVFFQRNKNYLTKISVFFNLSIAIYSIACIFWQLTTDIGSAYFWWKIFTVGIILINISFLHFVFILTGIIEKKKKILYGYYIFSFIFIGLNLSSLFYKDFEWRFGLGIWPHPTLTFNYYLFFTLFQYAYTFYCLLISLKKELGLKREQIKYFTLASLLGFAGGCTNWFVLYGIDISSYIAYFNLLVSLYVAVVAYSIIKYRFLNIKVVLSRATAFLLVYTLLLGIPFYVGIKLEYDPLFLLSGFFIAAGSPFLYRYVQRKTDGIILADQKYYHNILYSMSKEFVKEHDLTRLLETIVKAIKDTIQVNLVEIFLIDEEKKQYKFKSLRPQDFFPANFSIPFEHPVVDYFKEKEEPVFFEEIKDYFNVIEDNPIHLIIPVMLDDHLLAGFVLGQKENGSFYTEDDLNLFFTLSNQAALALQNSFIIEKYRLAQLELSRAERFSFIGGIAEGAAHQIRNRLSCFSLAAAEIRLKVDDSQEKEPEVIEESPFLKDVFQSVKELAGSIIENVSQTDGVVRDIISYSENRSENEPLDAIKIKDILEEAQSLIRVKYRLDDFNLEINIDLEEEIKVVKLELVEVFYTLLENSCEAILEKKDYLARKGKQKKVEFSPFIRIELEKKKGSKIIKVIDNGIGVGEKDKDKLFAPFFTTKSSFQRRSGFGSVLYIIKKIIEEKNQGELWFESSFLKGTTFFVKIYNKVM